MGNIGPPTPETGSGVWGTPANFNGFRILASLLQRRRSPEANQTLHDAWPFPGQVHYIYTFKGYIGSLTAWHSRSGRQSNFASWYKEWNYGTFPEGATYIRFNEYTNCVGLRTRFVDLNEGNSITTDVPVAPMSPEAPIAPVRPLGPLSSIFSRPTGPGGPVNPAGPLTPVNP